MRVCMRRQADKKIINENFTATMELKSAKQKIDAASCSISSHIYFVNRFWHRTICSLRKLQTDETRENCHRTKYYEIQMKVRSTLQTKIKYRRYRFHMTNTIKQQKITLVRNTEYNTAQYNCFSVVSKSHRQRRTKLSMKSYEQRHTKKI